MTQLSSSEIKFYEQAEPRKLIRAWSKHEKATNKKIEGHVRVDFFDRKNNPIRDSSSWKWLVDFYFDTIQGSKQPHIVAIVA